MKHATALLGLGPLALVIGGCLIYLLLVQNVASTASTALTGSALALPSANMKLPDVPAAKKQYVNTAYQAAEYYAQQDHLPSPIAAYFPLYFVRQIYEESNFNLDATPNSAGAVGIAQFKPSTAKGIHVLDPRTGKMVVVDPQDPVLALYGAAKMMADSFMSHLNQKSLNDNQLLAYFAALANYNCGCSIADYGTNGGQSLPSETRHYIYDILYPVFSQDGQQLVQNFVGLNACRACF